MASIYKLATDAMNQDRLIQPRNYLAANAEILFGTIVISLCITYFTNPDQLEDNPIKRMVGYNNPCVAWDAPPALYVAWFLFTPTVYFAVRYAITDSMRAFLKEDLSPTRQRLILAMNVTYALSQAICMGIFVVTPMDGTLFSMHYHSACFLQLVPTLGLCMCANYWENLWEGRGLSVVQWAVMVFYIIVTLLETVFAGAAVFLYKNDGVHVWPPMLMQAIDWGWFISLPLAAYFQPKDPGLEVVSTVMPHEDPPQPVDGEEGNCFFAKDDDSEEPSSDPAQAQQEGGLVQQS